MKQGYISNINPGNEALAFIDKRLLDDNYRGNTSSQHNRYTMEQIAKILAIFDNYASNKSLMTIRTTNISKRPQNIPDEAIYARFCDECKLAVGIGTQDAMRKNVFVDLHRMGLITRYDTERHPTNPYGRKRVKFVSLSEQGIRLVRAGSILDKYYIFSKGVDRLLGGFIGILLNMLGDPELRLRNISIYEFMFFVSAIGTESSFNINMDNCVSLMKSYRALSPVQRRSAVELLEDKAHPDNYTGDKPAKRDFHNWTNKALQIFYILNQTAYFEVREGNLYLKLGRSLSEKIQYFNNHRVHKTSGFELHHVVPLAWSESEYQFKLLDNWRNMVYIDAFSHAKITQNKNRNVLMTSLDDDVILSDYNERQVILVYGENVLYSTEIQCVMLQYNMELLDSVS